MGKTRQSLGEALVVGQLAVVSIDEWAVTICLYLRPRYHSRRMCYCSVIDILYSTDHTNDNRRMAISY